MSANRIAARSLLHGVAGVLLCLPAAAGADALPAPDSLEFCVKAQQILASTRLEGNNTLFTDMPEYRHSKPSAQPLLIYQVVTYRGPLPIVVSCKVKTAAHLRAVYGDNAAGEQYFCPEVTRRVQAQAAEELSATDTAAAERARSFIVDETEPSITGRSYLANFQPSHVAADGAIHLNSPGLFQDYDHWITSFLPEIVQGQSYCHIPTVAYLKALATGDMQPGTTVTTADDAPVRPAR